MMRPTHVILMVTLLFSLLFAQPSAFADNPPSGTATPAPIERSSESREKDKEKDDDSERRTEKRKINLTGVVTAYEKGLSITIRPKDGKKFKDGKTFTAVITSETKIRPRHRADQLAVGAYVSLSAVYDKANGQWIARQIEVRRIPTPTPAPTSITHTPTPGATNTPLPTTSTPTTLSPTVTSTALPPTLTTTPPAPTATHTQLPPTSTPPSPTATNTPVPPTATNTAVPPTATSTTAPLTWDSYAGPLFAANCTFCHGTRVARGGLSLETYPAALRGGGSGPGIVPGDPSASHVVIVQQKGNHPGQLTADELAKIIAWIQAGAPEK